MRICHAAWTMTHGEKVAEGAPGLKEVKQNNDPITTAVTVKEPEDQVNL